MNKYKADFKRMLKIKMAERGIDQKKDIARACGWTPQNYSNKMTRCDLRFSELEKIAEVLNCDIKIEFIDREI